MNKDYYIGVRGSYGTMSKILGRQVERLNTGMANHLRTTAMRKGIKKTELGERLEFYVVDQEEMDNLLDETWRAFQKLATNTICRPLVKVTKETFAKAVNKVNSKPEYSGRMDYKTHAKYKGDLAKSFDKAVEVVGTDLNPRKTKPKVAVNPFKVGDLIPFQDYGKIWTRSGSQYWGEDQVKSHYVYADKRIAKAGKKFVEIEHLRVKEGHYGNWPNTASAVIHFNDVNAYGVQGNRNEMQHGHAIPLESNADALEWVLERCPITDKPVKHQWNRLISGPSREQTRSFIDELIPAHCHSYEMG
jgi:hypothetical protein